MSADEEEQSTFVKSMFSPANRFPSQKENFDKVNIFEIVLIKLSVITVHYFLQKCLSTVELKKKKKKLHVFHSVVFEKYLVRSPFTKTKLIFFSA